MTKKGTSKSKSQPASSSNKPESIWRRILLLLPLTLLAGGLLLIFGAVFDLVIWFSPPAQALLGGLFVLISFVALNVLQKQWSLAVGWLLLGLGIWLWFAFVETWIRAVTYLMAGVGIFLIGKEFVRRFQEEQRAKKK
jgi:hypothetical protein